MGKKGIVAKRREPVTICDQLCQVAAEERIFTLRGVQVIIDRDLADLYRVETKVLNQAVRRNNERFPLAFRFQLTKEETAELIAKCDRLKRLKHSSVLPFAFSLMEEADANDLISRL